MEQGWAQRRLYDIGWADQKKCQGCGDEECTVETQVGPLPNLSGSWRPDPRGIEEVGTKASQRDQIIGR